MERAPDSQGASGNGDGSGETSTPSQSRPRLDFSVPGFSLFTEASEDILGLRRRDAADRAGDDGTAKEENVPDDDQTATVQDQESTEGSRQRVGGGDVVDVPRERVGAEQERENVVPDDQAARVEGQESAEGSRQTESENVVAGEMSGISNALEDEQHEEDTPGHDGDGRSTMIYDQTDTSMREWPLVGSKRGIEDRSAAIQGQESMQRSQARRGDGDAVASKSAVAGGSTETKWGQLFARLVEDGEKMKRAKEQKREQRRRKRDGEGPQAP
ncbi:uncharacterized protein LOC130138537 [Syzygium oleosum]|uniref:uncharacterized protein LOC130138537 n=1 Tax=Syzygium oleosum TaxID=219896 RepID=UPI0024BA17F1|nr:uncharacterized protein LOC130138537 [Syzygium oleosum]